VTVAEHREEVARIEAEIATMERRYLALDTDASIGEPGKFLRSELLDIKKERRKLLRVLPMAEPQRPLEDAKFWTLTAAIVRRALKARQPGEVK